MKISPQPFPAKLHDLHFHSSNPAACSRPKKVCQEQHAWADHLWGSRSAWASPVSAQISAGRCCAINSQRQQHSLQSHVTSKREWKWNKVGPRTAGGWREWSGTRTTKMMAFCFFMFWQQLSGDVPTLSQTLQSKLSFSWKESHKSLSADELQTWE